MLAWLCSLMGCTDRKVLMFRLSSQLPASSFIALTACCNGKAVFKQNIYMWVLDDSEVNEVLNDYTLLLSGDE